MFYWPGFAGVLLVSAPFPEENEVRMSGAQSGSRHADVVYLAWSRKNPFLRTRDMVSLPFINAFSLAESLVHVVSSAFQQAPHWLTNKKSSSTTSQQQKILHGIRGNFFK